MTPAVLDDLMGSLLDTADGAFDTLLGLGFAASIRREARWRAAAAWTPPTWPRSSAWSPAGVPEDDEDRDGHGP